MSKGIEVSDEHYQALLEAAAKQHENVVQFVARIANAELKSKIPLIYRLEEVFDALGVYALSYMPRRAKMNH